MTRRAAAACTNDPGLDYHVKSTSTPGPKVGEDQKGKSESLGYVQRDGNAERKI